MTIADAAGLLGAGLMLAAYAGAQAKRLDPHGVAALAMNALGAGLVIVSLTARFNLAAFLLEAAWGLVALWGLARLALARLRRRDSGGQSPDQDQGARQAQPQHGRGERGQGQRDQTGPVDRSGDGGGSAAGGRHGDSGNRGGPLISPQVSGKSNR